MRPLILCRERLNRILRLLERNNGALAVREFVRSSGVWRWELEQAAALGWIAFETHKPRTGRPAFLASIVSQTNSAKLPPWRCQIPKAISLRTRLFAIHANSLEPCSRAKFGYRMRPAYKAWMAANPRAKSKAGARATASRLRRRIETIAAKQWRYAMSNREIPPTEKEPETAVGTWLRLKELGSWRASSRWMPSYSEIEAFKEIQRLYPETD